MIILEPGEKTVAVGLSGGPDSMALCRMLADRGVDVHALTVDHSLRADSKAEAKRVAGWVKGWPGVTHKILTLRKAGKGRTLERAREGRYDAMAAYCRRHKIGVLYLAHHLDDQAETFLFRLAAGSGLDGLAAMRARQAYDETLMLVRPLLEVPKDSLVAFCDKNKIPYVKDPTNENPAYARARLRAAREVLEREGLSSKRLAVTAARMARAREALEALADKAATASLRNKTKNRVVLDYAALAAEPAEIRFRVLMGLAAGEGYGPRMEKMEALARDLFAPAPFRKQTLGGWIFSRKTDEIHIEKEKASIIKKAI